jgi:hypothetical protein
VPSPRQKNQRPVYDCGRAAWIEHILNDRALGVLLHGKLETTLRTLAVVAALSHRRTDGFAEQHFDRTANFRMTAHGSAERTAEASNP